MSGLRKKREWGVKKMTRLKRRRRIRARIAGTPDKPRLSVFRSSKHIYVQLIDDEKGITLLSASTLDEGAPQGSHKSIAAAQFVGELISKRAKEKGIENCIFDRSGYLYHGRVKALADKARESGLKF
jgi:large subunit ribosomal protein L18